MKNPEVKIKFDNTYARLPERFYAQQDPQAVKSPSLIQLNRRLAADLGIDADYLASAEGVAILAGNRIPEGAEPLATAYAGHQFGHFVPQLGDGRAVLLGEVITPEGARRDIQLKGSGRTPFSRGGDGRAWLGPVIREYILSEAMHALGVPTTRALAAVRTGESVMREAALPGAIVTRVASSHIRVGTFEYFAAREDREAVRILADHAIERHYPEVKDAANPYASFLKAFAERQAHLIARWLQLGFIHGVMNTDNMAISGETIDYGPCAFMDHYDPAAVFSSIDRRGRYAYGQQPHIAQWNIARLAEALLPLIDPSEEKAIKVAGQIVAEFADLFQTERRAGMKRKLGLVSDEEADAGLVQDFLDMLERQEADFTQSFRALTVAVQRTLDQSQLCDLIGKDPGWGIWKDRWAARIDRQPHNREAVFARMKQSNPAFIPRNHLVERAIQDAVGRDDLSTMNELIQILSDPYEDQPSHAHLTLPPRPEERVLETFCGT